MRTNIDIDDRLMREAMAAAGVTTKKETVELALRLLARRKQQANLRELFGAVEWEGDLHADRLDKPEHGPR